LKRTHPLNPVRVAAAIGSGSAKRPLSTSFEDVATNDRRTDAGSPLFDFLMPLATVTARFHRIQVPLGVTVSAEQSAFYTLRVWKAPADCIYFGARWQLCAAEVAPVGATLSWGDITGSSAAMVAFKGERRELAWSGENLAIPGLQINDAASAPGQTLVELAGGSPEYLWYQHLPPGDFGGATGAPMISGSYSTLPAGVLIRRGESITIGLATRPDKITGAGGSDDLRGRGSVTLHFASEWGATRRTQ